jgi:hypothetical protein
MASAPYPQTVTRRAPEETAIRVIRFAGRIARQCPRRSGRLADWVVCDTIANGSRLPSGRRGEAGGPIVRFERTYASGKARGGGRAVTVAVLGQLARHSCTALRLLSPATDRSKIWKDLGFLNRAVSK